MTISLKKLYRLLSYILLAVGIIAFGYGLSQVWQRFRPVNFSELEHIPQVRAAEDTAEALFPVQLIMVNQDITVPLIKGSVINGEWKLSEDAGLAIQTGTATQSGTVIYGHNYPRILGELNNAQVGNRFELVMSDWSKRQFEVVEVSEVQPDQVQAVVTAAENDLIVYTCSGFLDSKRLVVRARLVD